MAHKVTDLYTYPVKSLSPQRLENASLKAGGPFPLDRAFALKKGDWKFDRENPENKFKTFFHVLMRNERLAGLTSRFDPETGLLSLKNKKGGLVKENITTREGRAKLSSWLRDYLGAEVEILEAPGFSFPDVHLPLASIINLASVRALGEAIGADLDPLRFRGNIQIDGGPAWSEFDLVGKTFKIGGVSFETVKRISRCAATNVNLKTARRDQNLPKALIKHFGHYDMGIYAKVISAGTLKVGDGLTSL